MAPVLWSAGGREGPSLISAGYTLAVIGRAVARGARRRVPLLLTTGRAIYHFDTRTRTGQAPELAAAAPDAWVEGSAHADEADVFHICERLAKQCERHAGELQPFADRYGEEAPEEPDRLHGALFSGTREGPIGLLRDCTTST